jgi:hypothetical protein
MEATEPRVMRVPRTAAEGHSSMPVLVLVLVLGAMKSDRIRVVIIGMTP